MKKMIGLLLGIASVFTLASCDLSALMGGGGTSENSQTSQIVESVGGEENSEHKHKLTRVSERKATCTQEGNITHWTCDCGAYFADAMGKEEVTAADVILAKEEHVIKYTAGIEPNCSTGGRMEYWSCSKCLKNYADEACTQEVKLSDIILTAEHTLVHQEAKPVVGREDGVVEHWACSECGSCFADAEGTEKMKKSETVIVSVLGIPDFVVEVPAGRDPIVLQLSDTQIIDAAQERPGRGGIDRTLNATDKMDERCFNYLEEVITATNPDFIILTGDVVYGEFDDDGSALTKLVDFMDGFQIPWSPVFGNHDNESKKGADWQCDLFENSQYCLFDQKELSGNGNYSVGIAQDGEMKRVFYMLDTHACGNASQESKDNGHTLANRVGFQQDQMDWYTEEIKLLKKYVPEVKISFAYHIQQWIFGKAYASYGFNQSEKYQDINLDMMEGVAESDFGYIGRQMKGEWDTDYKIYKAMKELGVDSIFVGHEHCNNVSVVYEGIRFTYGLKSSEYDRFNWLNADGTITGGWIHEWNVAKTGKPLVGGTVTVLSEDDGEIEDCYNYYCGFENGKINWDDYKPAEVINVNGLQYGGINATTAQMWGDGPVYAEAVKFDDTTNAWKVTAGGQGKLYINTSLLKGKTTLTFSLYIENALGSGALDPFSLRVKPDNDSIAGLPGAAIDSNSKKQYIQFKVGDKADADAVRLQLGVWQTFTVDISKFADVCTELSFNIYTGNTLYLKDIALS